LRILADENVHAGVVAGLRERGHVVEWLAETAPGTPDDAILARTDIGSWVLLTYDRDFGDLIFNRGMPCPAGIIYSRLERPKPEVLLERLEALIATGVIPGQFVVIDPDHERARQLPIR
jgi:predicted nuclease of predicted toxin-antitoxin system